MKVLVINAGSSSLKYQLMDPATREVFAKGPVSYTHLAQGARPFPSSPAALRLGQSISPA